MVPFGLWVAVALAGSLPSRAEQPAYVLIVANNASNDPKLAPLRYADDDGARYHDLFAPQASEVVLLSVLDEETQRRHPGLAAKTKPPTRKELTLALAHLNARMKEDRARDEKPLFYFVYTGHGQRGPAGEGTISLLGANFSRSELFQEVLEPSEAATLHLIIDACDSYYFVSARGELPVAQGQAEVVRHYLDERSLSRFPHVGVVLSTNSQKESHEWAAIGAGVFSHQVRSALFGAADVNGDGKVEYSELSAFIAAANLRVEDPRGRLQIFTAAPALDRAAPIADLTRRSLAGHLLVPASLSGRHWVEDERGVRWVEFHKEPERPLVLALPPGRTYHLRSPSLEARFIAASGQLVDAASLRWTAYALASRGSLDEAFRVHLFATPFGAKFYGGYVSSSGEPPVAAPVTADFSP
ncbi:MAG: hypothetical protein ACOZIN_04130 [Myxococcota bacterium]